MIVDPLRHIWEFDEQIDYINYKLDNKNYKVLKKYNNYSEAANYLHNIRKIIDIISLILYISLKYNYSNYNKDDIEAFNVFLSIHPHNYLLSEMKDNTGFNGMNKPRNIYYSNNYPVGKDSNKRAKYRDIFLTLRKNNGSFKNFNTIMKLVLHEIAHTMCNHVLFRYDDHGDDFKKYEQVLIDIYEYIISNKELLL